MRVVTYGFGMRSEMRRLGAAAAVVAAVLCLGACAPEDPGPKPSPDPTSTPLFASDEEALAAAEEAYGRYQAVEAQIFIEGGANGDRIDEVAVRDALLAAREGFADYQTNGFRNVGATEFDVLELQHYSPSPDLTEDVVGLYICLDFSNQDVVNEENISVVRPGRLVRQAFEVSFDVSADKERLVLSSREPWGSDEICAQ